MATPTVPAAPAIPEPALALRAGQAQTARPIPDVVREIVQSLQLTQSQPLPPPATMSLEQLATAEILGQDPGLRRLLSPAVAIIPAAWRQAASAPGQHRYRTRLGNGRLVAAGTAALPQLEIRDGYGEPVKGLPVQFVVQAGGGTLPPGDGVATTNDDGVASPDWRLGPAEGLNTLVALIALEIVATFNAVAIGTQHQPPAAGPQPVAGARSASRA
jgi:hypothetical protein